MDQAGDSTFPNWPELRRLFTYDELIGKVLQGRYEVLRRLGAGGMGVVFLARHVHLDKLFALKVISARFLDEPEIGRRFLLEAQAASKIDHPNVVGITDFGPPEDGPTFFVMEYLEGEDLACTLARHGPLAWPRALHIIAQIARALAAAHQRGVVHRDIKPQNCLRISRDGDPDFIKVLDFGLAKVLTGTGKSTWTVGGSPGYIAPEIYRGGRTDHRVDIFALGVVLHALLLGRLPAQDPADVELPPHLSAPQPADLPPPLRDLIDRATADDPAQRYPSADAFLAALAEARARIESPSEPALIALSQRPPRPRRLLLLAGVAAAALAAIIALAGAPPLSEAPARAPEAPREIALPPTPIDPPPEPQPQPAAPAPEDMSDRPLPEQHVPLKKEDLPQRRPLASFDSDVARALLQRRAADIRACKADSSFRSVAAVVRIDGTVTVSPRGKATVALPAGYDVSPCIERLIAGLRFRPSLDGGAFEFTFLL